MILTHGMNSIKRGESDPSFINVGGQIIPVKRIGSKLWTLENLMIDVNSSYYGVHNESKSTAEYPGYYYSIGSSGYSGSVANWNSLNDLVRLPTQNDFNELWSELDRDINKVNAIWGNIFNGKYNFNNGVISGRGQDSYYWCDGGSNKANYVEFDAGGYMTPQGQGAYPTGCLVRFVFK